MGRHHPDARRRPAEPPATPEAASTAETRDISESKALRLITIDQAIAGASNLAIILMASHALGRSSGLFVIIFTVYSLALGASRSLVGDPTLVHPREARERPGEPIGAAILLGFALAALILAAGAVTLVWNREMGYALIDSCRRTDARNATVGSDEKATSPTVVETSRSPKAVLDAQAA